MAKGDNVHFVVSTRGEMREVLRVGGTSVWENCNATFRRIDQLCGDGASRLFAEPTVKRGENNNIANVAWFGSHDDDAKPLETSDPPMRRRVKADLAARLEALRPALSDPEVGERVAAMLNVYSDDAIMALGEYAVLTNWGILPSAAIASQAAFATHTDATIGPYLNDGISPRVPDQPWRFAGNYQSPREMAFPAAVPSLAPAVVRVAASRPYSRTRLLLPGVLALILAGVLFYILLPGSLIFEKIFPIDPALVAERTSTDEELTKRIALLHGLGKKDACEAEKQWTAILKGDVASQPDASVSPSPSGATPSAAQAPDTPPAAEVGKVK